MKSRQLVLLLTLNIYQVFADEVEIEADGNFQRPPPDAHLAAKIGVDHSFPMQHRSKPLGNQAKVYQEFLDGCFEKYGEPECLSSEDSRLELNYRQPPRMTNFTAAGYAKVKAPPSVMAILTKFWSANTNDGWGLEQEGWPAGNTYVNHWASPSEMLSIDGPNGLSRVDKRVIEGQVGQILSDWVGGVELVPTSTYGIRSYGEGSVLAPHIDRLPLVASAIVNVAQEVREPWPLEVIDHSGRAVNVTIEPGEMILYESHSVIHGRPYPLQGE